MCDLGPGNYLQQLAYTCRARPEIWRSDHFTMLHIYVRMLAHWRTFQLPRTSCTLRNRHPRKQRAVIQNVSCLADVYVCVALLRSCRASPKLHRHATHFRLAGTGMCESSLLLQFLVVFLGHPGCPRVCVQHDLTTKHNVVIDGDAVVLNKVQPLQTGCSTCIKWRFTAQLSSSPVQVLPSGETERLINLNSPPNFGAQSTVNV